MRHAQINMKLVNASMAAFTKRNCAILRSPPLVASVWLNSLAPAAIPRIVDAKSAPVSAMKPAI